LSPEPIEKEKCLKFDDADIKYSRNQRDNIIRAILNVIYLLGVQEEIYRRLK